jgi:predicted enzyme related to lactoylglutathione lyase
VIRLGRVAPTVGVRDMTRALAFYESVFGFQRTFENGEPVSFVVLKRDGAEVHLQAVAGDSALREHNVMHLLVEGGVDELYVRCAAAAGGKIVSKLRDAPWGMRTFVVADPDGNRIDVGQPL